MVLSLSYRRPAYITSSRNSVDSEKGGPVESITSTSSCPYGIPDALSFDRIISGGTCPVSPQRFTKIKAPFSIDGSFSL